MWSFYTIHTQTHGHIMQMAWYLLRGYGYILQGIAVLEGTVKYRHQGGGQHHTGQFEVSCNNNILSYSTFFYRPKKPETCTQTSLNQVRELTRERILPDDGDSPERNRRRAS